MLFRSDHAGEAVGQVHPRRPTDRAYDPHRDVSPLAASGYRYAPAIAWYGLPLGCRVPTPQSETPATPMDCAPDSYRQVPADSGAWQSDVFELDFRAAHRRRDPSTGTISLGGAGFVPHYLRSEPRSAAQTKRAGAHSPSALWVVRLQRDPAGRTNPDAPFSVEVWESRGDRKSTRLNSSHTDISRMPSSA